MLHGIDTHDQEYTNVQSGLPYRIRDVCCILLRLYLVLPLPLDDIQAAEDILLKCYNKEVTGTVNPFFGRKLNDYNRQFISAETQTGDKVIWINCFCYVENEYFKNQICID